mmetsp:Transcript_11869/g.50835  ORF Transcript_11869/g.50835 Transcript_11869/m.50835 type:complete len:229 (-) Transcript_11869:4558-5244(-)
MTVKHVYVLRPRSDAEVCFRWDARVFRLLGDGIHASIVSRYLHERLHRECTFERFELGVPTQRAKDEREVGGRDVRVVPSLARLGLQIVRAFRFVQSSPVRVVREPVNLPSMVVVQKAKNELYEEQHNQCACGELSHSSYMRLRNFHREYHRDSWTRASSTLEVPFCSTSCLVRFACTFKTIFLVCFPGVFGAPLTPACLARLGTRAAVRTCATVVRPHLTSKANVSH